MLLEVVPKLAGPPLAPSFDLKSSFGVGFEVWKELRIRWNALPRPDLKRGCCRKEEEKMVIEIHYQLGTELITRSRTTGNPPQEEDEEDGDRPLTSQAPLPAASGVPNQSSTAGALERGWKPGKPLFRSLLRRLQRQLEGEHTKHGF
ncbi:hypothetical protein C4D60_Mb00t20070 [Musa balbisiana]|uniref:Uncharacterized protein n=1 Tax=Musa balbisiana TaxID=52838 RepID=A0A4S8I4K8_MUSBA|nr:hypothetical protein C4D60_Mb00t20070 [Musa balbisiana]